MSSTMYLHVQHPLVDDDLSSIAEVFRLGLNS